MYALELVDQQAQRHIETSEESVDDLEAIMALRIHMSDEFNLPFSTRNMLFETEANLTPEIIANARNSVRASLVDETKLNEFLANWPPMQTAKRREQAKDILWVQLPAFQINRHDLKNIECSLTGKPWPEINYPVIISTTSAHDKNNSINIIELDALLHDWSNRGKHLLTNQPMSLNQLQAELKKVLAVESE